MISCLGTGEFGSLFVAKGEEEWEYVCHISIYQHWGS